MAWFEVEPINETIVLCGDYGKMLLKFLIFPWRMALRFSTVLQVFGDRVVIYFETFSFASNFILDRQVFQEMLKLLQWRILESSIGVSRVRKCEKVGYLSCKKRTHSQFFRTK
jgi:hypothetical protein